MYINSKKRLTLTAVLILVMVMTMFSGCGSKDEPADDAADVPASEEVIGDIKVTLSIDFPDTKGQADVEDIKIGLTEESSVLDVLFAYANENDIEVLTEGEEDPYVTSIGGVIEDGSWGWTYTINDEIVMESAGKAMIKNGDEVQWEYSDMNAD